MNMRTWFVEERRENTTIQLALNVFNEIHTLALAKVRRTYENWKQTALKVEKKRRTSSIFILLDRLIINWNPRIKFDVYLSTISFHSQIVSTTTVLNDCKWFQHLRTKGNSNIGLPWSWCAFNVKLKCSSIIMVSFEWTIWMFSSKTKHKKLRNFIKNSSSKKCWETKLFCHPIQNRQNKPTELWTFREISCFVWINWEEKWIDFCLFTRNDISTKSYEWNVNASTEQIKWIESEKIDFKLILKPKKPKITNCVGCVSDLMWIVKCLTFKIQQKKTLTKNQNQCLDIADNLLILQNKQWKMILPSVFVQIPPQNANLVPSKSSAVNSQSVGRHDEIKAEPPIKSEIDNANQSQTVGASKLNKELSTASGQTSKSTTKFPSTTTCSQSNLTANLVTARPKVKCFKCERCPFMSISQDGYNFHIQSVHNNDRNSESASNRSFRNKILCPGCENVFYSKMSLKIHFMNDHQMSRPDISQLLESLFAKKSPSKCLTSSNENANTELNPSENGSEKQKIYLKNVEVLQNPRFNNCQFSAQNSTPPTNLSPSETPSECSSNLTDEIANNDASIVHELNFNRITVRSTFDQLDNDCLYQHIETSFPMVSSGQSMRNECMNMNDNRERMPMTAISPSIIEIASIDEAQANRPDSGSSVKFSDNFMNVENIWPTSNTVTTSSSNSSSDGNFSYQSPHMNLNNPLPSMKIPLCSNLTPSVSPLPSVPLNERKKIYIKNIDILKEPLIKPAQTVTLTDSNCRKNTLHLRTVDEVNLLINKVSTRFLYEAHTPQLTPRNIHNNNTNSCER